MLEVDLSGLLTEVDCWQKWTAGRSELLVGKIYLSRPKHNITFLEI